MLIFQNKHKAIKQTINTENKTMPSSPHSVNESLSAAGKVTVALAERCDTDTM